MNAIVVSGHDRHAAQTAGSAGFNSGANIPDTARLIIGTSAIEVGISLPRVTALITDPGRDPATLIQRIGRVARGADDGEVHVVAGGRGTQATVSDHILKLREFTGRVSVDELIDGLGTLKSFDAKRAAELGSAYFSMLRRSDRNLGNAFAGLFEHIEREQGKRPIKPYSLLDAIKLETKKFKAKKPYHPFREAIDQWLQGVDLSLRDLRGWIIPISRGAW